MRHAFLLASAALALASPASAEDRSCVGVFFDDTPALHVGRIKPSSPRVNFIRSGDAKTPCPSEGAQCREKAYLIAGDLVVLGTKLGDYVCAEYASAKKDRNGWLPSAAIEPVAPLNAPGAWTGKWERVEAEIAIKLKGGALQAEGTATYGASDPDRVKRGAVNVGDFEGALALKDGQAVYSDENGCVIRMVRAGAFLFVRDNQKCGGFNVTFDGLYRRGK